MFKIAKFLVLSLGVVSLVIGCRSEFGYKKRETKTNGGKTPSSPTFKITADKLEANIKGYPNSTINFSAFCKQTGTKVIDWDMGDGTRLRGDRVSHSFAQKQVYNVKATCRGTVTLSDSLSVSATIPGQFDNNQNPNQGTIGKGDGSTPIYDDYDIPPQPKWQYEVPQYPGKY